MAKSCSSDGLMYDFPRLALVALCASLVGCTDDSERAEKEPVRQTAVVTNAVEAVVLTADQKEAVRMRSLLDDGERLLAYQSCRKLLRSSDKAVRIEVASALPWIGRRAIPELTALLEDSENDVALLAQQGWDAVYDEIQDEAAKMSALTNAVARLNDPSVINALLLKSAVVEPTLALPALEGLIQSCRGRVVSGCAKGMFEHLAGEPWASPERTRKLIQSLQ